MSLALPLALVLPFVIGLLYYLNHTGSLAVLFPSTATLTGISPSLRLQLRKPCLYSLASLLVVLLAIGASRPQKVTVLQEDYKSRNIMLAIDLSRSMATADFDSRAGLIGRIDGVKEVVANFISEREKDRIGLVVFGVSAFVQAPLTRDHNLVEQMVSRLDVGIAGDGTAIGDGLGLAIKRIADVPVGTKAIILLTDGVNNSGQVNPIKAALVAKDLGVKVHTIGIGSNGIVSQGMGGMFFGQVQQRAEFDEAMLKEIANTTGGVYFNASNVEGLKKVYEQIEALEKTDTQEPEHQIVEEYFYYFAILGLISFLAYTLLSQTILMKIP